MHKIPIYCIKISILAYNLMCQHMPGTERKALIWGTDLYGYIPQRPPIVMVDSYYGKDDVSSFTGYTPVSGSLFCDRGFFLEAGIIEHMAQSVAVSAGIEYKSRGEAVPLGFIGAVSKLSLHFRVPVGKKLFTAITEAGKFEGVSLVTARVMCEDRLVAEGELKVFILGNSK